MQLHRSAFSTEAITPVAEARQALEQGKAASGSVVVCNHIAVQVLRRLATLHQIKEAKVALLTPHGTEEKGPENSKVLHFPTCESNKPNVRKFWVTPLVQNLPDLPEQAMKQTKVAVDTEPLVTFRATYFCNLCSRDFWESCKQNPAAQIFKLFDKGIVHSTFGWREISVPNKKEGTDEAFLQGFVRTKKQFATKIESHMGSDGLFIERLASDSVPRPPVWWVPCIEGETACAYHTRSIEEAKSQGATLAHRRGGGAFLGLRLLKGKPKPQRRAWSLHNAPKAWTAQDAIQCVLDSGATDVEVVRPPGRQRNWLFKAVVPDESDLGVVTIEAKDRTLLLNWVQGRPQRNVNVVSVIRASKQKVAECTVLLPPAKPTGTAAPARANPNNGPGQTAAEAGNRSRERSRSPPRQAEVSFPVSGKFEKLDCGGGGDCGYLCLAAGMGFDRGDAWESLQPELPTRSRTIHNDIYKHMTNAKHEAEYKTYFVPGLIGDAAQEGGEPPKDWETWTESTLRPGRWIDGLSIQAACKRYGLHVIVVPSNEDPKNRPMVFGRPRSGRPPIVLLLHAGHYQLARLKTGKQRPQEFTEADPAAVSDKIFRGGGKGNVWHTPQRPSASQPWRPLQTPSSASEASWRPARTPSTAKQSQGSARHSWRPAKTPQSKTGGQASTAISSKALVTCRKRSKTAGSSIGTAPAKLERVRVEGPQTTFHQVDKYRWTCNLCQEVLRGNKYKSISCARLRHVQQVHKKEAKKVHPLLKKRVQIVTPSAAIPPDQRSWSCPKCNKGFGSLTTTALLRSRLAHEKQCYGLTSKQLKKRCYSRESWQAKHKKTVADNAAINRGRTDDAIKQYNAVGPGFLFRVPGAHIGTERDQFSCAVCTLFSQKWNGLDKHQCEGASGRQRFIAHHRRRMFWAQHRRDHPELISFLVTKWKITAKELQILEKGVATAGGRRGITPAQQCSWFKDVTQDGDVHPNPGPSAGGPCFKTCMINAGGSSGAWAVARWVVRERLTVAVVQEHALLPEKQADMSRFLKKHGYRAWFVAPANLNNIKGQAYTTGGVSIWVRQDKPAREVHRWCTISGQALMIELDNLYFVGVYLPPHTQEQIDATLSVLDEWVMSLGGMQPVLLAGDFNSTAALADRWRTLAGRGAAFGVQGSDGEWMPTRWTGPRAIDWGWCSHPHMVQHVQFLELAISDHP